MAGDVAFVICDDHRGLLARRGFLEFRRALLSVDFRIFVGLPPATEVWLRYASPQVASLINGVNERGAVIERRRSRSVFPQSGTSVAGGEFFFSSRRRHTSCGRDWSSDVCSSDLPVASRTIAP